MMTAHARASQQKDIPSILLNKNPKCGTTIIFIH